MLILGSSSPYRAELLKKLGLEFQTFSPNIDEGRKANESPKELVLRLATQKAQEVAKHKSGIIIASDQVATLYGEILNKPNTKENAIKQLTKQSGNRVQFLTSLCVLDSQTNKSEVIVDTFTVYFKTLSVAQITRYIDKEDVLNCAGSFKSEGLGIALFEKLEGDDPNSLMGLPLIKLITLLKKFNTAVL